MTHDSGLSPFSPTMLGAPTNIRVLKGCHQGATVHVVASGASLDYLDRRYFEGKMIVAVNEMWQHVPATYVVAHHHERLQEALDAGQCVVTSERDWGMPGWGQPCALRGAFFTYRTADNTRTVTPTIDVEALAQDTTDSLVVSPCSTSEALQFAAHLGAATILCCGIDGAALDGQWCTKGYNHGAQTNPQHIRLTLPIVHATLAALRRKGIRVFSLSPFVGADHEGHVYTPAPELSGRDLIRALSTVNWQQPEAVR